jgi:hypothetical protein
VVGWGASRGSCGLSNGSARGWPDDETQTEACQMVERPYFKTLEWLAGGLRGGTCGLQSRESGMSVTGVGRDRANSTVGSIPVGVGVEWGVVDLVAYVRRESE